jgi:hypothetical protein
MSGFKQVLELTYLPVFFQYSYSWVINRMLRPFMKFDLIKFISSPARNNEVFFIIK